MIQPIRRQGRVPLLALLVVALATLVSISLARVTTGSAVRTAVAPPAVATELVMADRPVLPAPATTSGCSSGAYVSGDMAGDASPAEIYAVMCASR